MKSIELNSCGLVTWKLLRISRRAGLAAAAISALPLYSQSVDIPPSDVQFGMIGLAASQTLRLSIVAFPPTPVFPTAPICVAQLGFANGSGGAIGPRKLVSLNPGQGDFLDLNGVALALPSAQRGEVRPVVTLQPSALGGTSACLAVAEIVDSFSAFSLVLAPGAAAAVTPGPSQFGLQGVAWGQVLRLNVVAPPPNSCVAQLSFVDKQGNPAGPAPKTVNLSAGQADHLDVAGSSLVAGFGQRGELAPGGRHAAWRGGIHVCGDRGSLRRVQRADLDLDFAWPRPVRSQSLI